MTKSEGSVVVGGERAGDGLAVVVVVPDGGGQSEKALQDAYQDALGAVTAVAFQAELGLQGGVDRFDDLAQRLELRGTGPGAFVAAGRADDLTPRSARRASNSADA